MEWVVGIFGFIAGFAGGQMLLLRLLKEKSRHDLLNDKNLRWKYGLFNWMIAGATTILALGLWRYYFPAGL